MKSSWTIVKCLKEDLPEIFFKHSPNRGREGPAQVDWDIFLKVWGDGGFPNVFSDEFCDKFVITLSDEFRESPNKVIQWI